MIKTVRSIAVACSVAALFSGVASAQSVDLTGAGATFPYPIYSKWFSDYAQASGVKINYQSIGSGGGIRQLSEQTGARRDGQSRAHWSGDGRRPLLVGTRPARRADVRARDQSCGLGHLDLLGRAHEGLTSVAMNEEDVRATLAKSPLLEDLDPTALMFLVRLGHRRTYKAGDVLMRQGEPSNSIHFLLSGKVRGLGGKGNEGVAGQVKQTPGSIGYVELAYAKQNKLPYANVRNAAGRYVTPTIASVTAAAAGMKLPNNTDYRVSIVNAQGNDSYPISSMTWILVYQNQLDRAKGQKLVDFLRWAYTSGEKSAESLDYAPLPAAMRVRLEKRLASINVSGAQVGAAR